MHSVCTVLMLKDFWLEVICILLLCTCNMCSDNKAESNLIFPCLWPIARALLGFVSCFDEFISSAFIVKEYSAGVFWSTALSYQHLTPVDLKQADSRTHGNARKQVSSTPHSMKSHPFRLLIGYYLLPSQDRFMVSQSQEKKGRGLRKRPRHGGFLYK